MKRRNFIAQSGAIAGAALANPSVLASPPAVNLPKGKAEHVVFIWLGGGMSQIDTFDPKRRGNSQASPKLAGSEYDAIDTVVPGVQFCEHLPRSAKLADRMTAIRTVNHHLVDEHAFGTNFVHTGRPISGSTTYPSIGSIVSHVRGAANPDVPAYMLIGYPNVARGPGFLGPKAGYVYLVDTESGPAGFSRPADVTALRVDRRRQLLQPLTDRVPSDSLLSEYRTAQAEALRLAGPDFMRHFRLQDESDDLRNAYGGEFGQRCLLARRLVQAGVRFIEVSHNLNFINGTGWDTHNEGQQNQHVLIKELDIALSALITDLEQQGILDKTLIAIGTEFGRPAEYDGRGGRGHQGTCFSLVLAGGGLNHQGAYGVTDELSKKIVEKPVSVPDFHATIHAALGINPGLELFDGSRPIPITDQGKPVAALFG
ncbi:hypothetical protein RISK_000644 [Rhodopirellula islandica]|uniref:DUF1501 domain-containing protein n=1 Tax=Rhodopirellula islandica TaxID=595434 RepID=A0A0J1BLZ8_RHOIS|nr:DUF1501 domain-containing protein [Rhodopirellula islandica]KLU07566.1 hypothetical protein RISK_000644 [Rhodopirellula islandica]